MRKLLAWGLPDEESAPVTRTFTDPDRPAEEFSLCLLRPGLLEQAAIQETAEAYCAEYLETDGGKPFLAPGGKLYRLNRAAIWEVSAVYCLQGGPAADRYLWTDLLGIYLKRPALWRQASVWAGELLDEERQAIERATGLGKPGTEAAAPEAQANGAEASAPPSSAASLTPTRKTPKPRPAATTSSARSPTASAP